MENVHLHNCRARLEALGGGLGGARAQALAGAHARAALGRRAGLLIAAAQLDGLLPRARRLASPGLGLGIGLGSIFECMVLASLSLLSNSLGSCLTSAAWPEQSSRSCQ